MGVLHACFTGKTKDRRKIGERLEQERVQGRVGKRAQVCAGIACASRRNGGEWRRSGFEASTVRHLGKLPWGPSSKDGTGPDVTCDAEFFCSAGARTRSIGWWVVIASGASKARCGATPVRFPAALSLRPDLPAYLLAQRASVVRSARSWQRECDPVIARFSAELSASGCGLQNELPAIRLKTGGRRGSMQRQLAAPELAPVVGSEGADLFVACSAREHQASTGDDRSSEVFLTRPRDSRCSEFRVFAKRDAPGNFTGVQVDAI